MSERDPEWGGENIPWDVFWWRNPIIRNITESGVTRQETYLAPKTPGLATAFHFQVDDEHFWEVELKAILDRTNSVMYPVNGSDIRVWGDGVRLLLPRIWMEDMTDDDLIMAIITGINVSLQNRSVLGY